MKHFDLIKLIDEYLIKSNTKRDITSHHCSAITSCIRQQWFKWKKFPESNPIDGSDLLKMKIGSLIHDFLAEAFDKSGVDVISEIEFRVTLKGCMFPLSGRCDSMFVDPTTNKIALIETKTSFGRGIIAIKDDGKPKIEHIWQIVSYILFGNVDRAYCLYIARDSSYKTQFLIERVADKIVVEGKDFCSVDAAKLYINNKLIAIEDSLTKDSPPDRPFVIPIKDGVVKDYFQRDNVKYKVQWNCSYCQFLNDCYQDQLLKYSTGDNYNEVIDFENKQKDSIFI